MKKSAQVCTDPDNVMMVIADAPRVKPRASISSRIFLNIIESAYAGSHRQPPL